MKNVVAIALFLSINFSNAQVLLGLKGGYNTSSVDIDTRNIENTEARSASGFHIGAEADIGINEYLSLKTEVLYSQKGYARIKYFDSQNFTDKNERNSDRWELSSHYLEIPMLLNYYYEGRQFKFFLNAGPYTAFWFGGSFKGDFFTNNLGDIYLKYKEVNESYAFDDSFGTNHLKDNRWDIGAAVGSGLAYKIKRGEIFFEARYNHGFLDLHKFEGSTPPKTYSNQYNRCWTFSLGYMMTLKAKRKVEDQEDEESTETE